MTKAAYDKIAEGLREVLESLREAREERERARPRERDMAGGFKLDLGHGSM